MHPLGGELLHVDKQMWQSEVTFHNFAHMPKNWYSIDCHWISSSCLSIPEAQKGYLVSVSHFKEATSDSHRIANEQKTYSGLYQRLDP